VLHHGKKTAKLSRTATHRKAMLANMAASLFLHSKMTTTTPKAKALRPYVDRLITKAKDGTLHSKRLVASYMPHKEALKKLFEEIAPKMSERNSGFSRVIKAGVRRGDNAEVSVIELLMDKPIEAVEKQEGKAKAAKAKDTASAATARRGKAKAAKAAKAGASKPKAAKAAKAGK
jgi:large subunit ribosomal protein L17